MSKKIVVSKPGFDADTETNPSNLIFSSDYNTLKYDTEGTIGLEIDASAGDIADKGTVTHNLGYYPYAEAFVDVYDDGVPDGVYEPVPFLNTGASVFYRAIMIIGQNNLEFYAEIQGMSSNTWNFDFKYFIYKNDATP